MKKYSEIGQRLKELREQFSRELKVDLSQKKFAQRLNVSLRAYQNYEAGERIPPGPVLSKIAEFYDCTSDYILTGDEKLLRQHLLNKLEKAGWKTDETFKEIFLIWRDLDEEGQRDVFKYMKDKQKLSEFLRKHKK